MAALALAWSDFVIVPSACAVAPNARPRAAARMVTLVLVIVFTLVGWGCWIPTIRPCPARVGLPAHTALCALPDRPGAASRARWPGKAMSAPKPIQLILARQLASSLAVPILLVDTHGTLVYYNEPAEQILGQRFEETGEMRADVWSKIFAV